MTKLVIANFKMNGSKDFIESWIQDFFLEQESANDVVVALPSPYLIIFNDRGLTLSGQNVSNEESGAFTSQLSAQMLKDCGAKYCLIGHSEARQFLKEKNEVIKQKFDQFLKNIWMVISDANKYVDEQAPWSLKKNDYQRMEVVLYTLTETIRQISIMLQPFIPNTSKAILDHIDIPLVERDIKSIQLFFSGGIKISTPNPLFPRI